MQRIHYGAFYVAESKYQTDAKQYSGLITSGNIQGLMKRLKNKEVEEEIIRRVKAKVESSQKSVDGKNRVLLDAEVISEFYENVIIPLTCEGEIAYFMNRKNLDLTKGVKYSFDINREKHPMGFGSVKRKESFTLEGVFLQMTSSFYAFKIDGAQSNILGNDISNIRSVF